MTGHSMAKLPPLARMALALVIGAAGGGTFFALGLPLPWMLGSMFASMAAAVGRVPVTSPARLRPVVVAVIGVMLGARFTPEVLAQAGAWAGTLAILSVYIILVSAIVVPFYRFVGRLDWTTAYFAGMPGGLTEMIEFGEARGATVPPIILAHSLRIVMTIALVAFWFRVVMGHEVGAAPGPAAGSLTLADSGLLALAALIGAWLGRVLRFPAPAFLGPMLVSALLHLAGLTEAAPPAVLVSAAQVALGAVLGCRFQGIAPGTLFRAGWLALGSTVLTLALAALAGLAMRAVAGTQIEQAILAMAPGGLTEMGLIALAIHADVAFVALHHVARILLVLLLAPLAFRWVERR